MKTAINHVENGLLIRYLDGELPQREGEEVRTHLASCSQCGQMRDEFASLSCRVDVLVNAQPVAEGSEIRGKIVAAARSEGAAPSRVMKRFTWGMAVAATLAVGILLAPRPHRSPVTEISRQESNVGEATSFDVNGESFIALPYSNPELPMNAPRIVEMRVPISSLAPAGIFFQPAANSSGDRTVLANVLLGMDGQPLGVHVLSAE